MQNRPRIILISIIWLAFFWRLPGLFGNTFHADEALFASWARHIAVWKDPLLITQAVDKPPLLFYLQALFYPQQGPVEWAARLPNFIVSILLVPLTAVLFRRLYHEKWGAVAAAVVIACSPLAIQFSPTAFTDPLLTFWLVAAMSMQVASGKYASMQAASGQATPIHQPPCLPTPLLPRSPPPPHPLTAGFFFGLAVATKYQAWLFLPLLLGLGWLNGHGRHHWLRWLAGFGPVVGVVVLWDMVRSGTFSLWSAQIGNYGGVRLAWAWELWPRLAEWVKLWRTAVPIYLLILLLLLMGWLVVRSGRMKDSHGRTDLILILFISSYLLLHWLLSIPVWDRYMLPLVPLVALLIGRGISEIGDWRLEIRGQPISNPSTSLRTSLQSPISIILLFLLLLFPAWSARHSRYPIGGQPGADDGAAQIATYLLDAPYGTVLYDHWYSWHWRYHFFDKGVYVSWFPNADALTKELSVFGGNKQPRYITLPNTAASQPIHRAIHQTGFTLQPVHKAGNITLYRIATR
ncbi:MAG: phospholipid carrier-dependent glycosyltransferase [Chloroflexi bacterium]|nr:phospholipid carrier-dependent glycosyltransferase [Chloroflexota bacterium]